MRRLILWNLAALAPFAAWMLAQRLYVRCLIAVLACAVISLLWPLPPVPAIASLVIALSLRRRSSAHA